MFAGYWLCLSNLYFAKSPATKHPATKHPAIRKNKRDPAVRQTNHNNRNTITVIVFNIFAVVNLKKSSKLQNCETEW